jgi:acyl carrier protein phosphodiesterase
MEARAMGKMAIKIKEIKALNNELKELEDRYNSLQKEYYKLIDLNNEFVKRIHDYENVRQQTDETI